jgi:hypothetical protein
MIARTNAENLAAANSGFPTIFSDSMRMNRGATGQYNDIPRYFMEGIHHIPCVEPSMNNATELVKTIQS